jgi:hypothetical protein
MDIPRDLFKRAPDGIARGLKRAALQSRRTKGTKFQSAMSMLNLYVNRAGRTLPSQERLRLAAAKEDAAQGLRSTPRAAGLGTPSPPERASGTCGASENAPPMSGGPLVSCP